MTSTTWTPGPVPGSSGLSAALERARCGPLHQRSRGPNDTGAPETRWPQWHREGESAAGRAVRWGRVLGLRVFPPGSGGARVPTSPGGPSPLPIPATGMTDTAVRSPGTALTGDALAALVPLAAEGDQAAFARLVAAFHADMARVAYLACGGDRELARDAVQSAWAIAWSRLGTLRDPHGVRSWLLTVTTNEARQEQRRQRRVVSVALDDIDEPESPEQTPSASVIDMNAVVAGLSAEERVLVGLRYGAGLESAEIGRILGISASGVRSRLDRLLDRLRRELDDG